MLYRVSKILQPNAMVETVQMIQGELDIGMVKNPFSVVERVTTILKKVYIQFGETPCSIMRCENNNNHPVNTYLLSV